MPTLDDFFGTPEDEYVEIVESYLGCKEEGCGGVANTGRYYQEDKTLVFTCPKCETKNTVRDIQINV